MSLLSKIRAALGFDRPALRNKPGGMAMVKNVDGAVDLNGRIVKTIRIKAGTASLWHIEPEQVFILSEPKLATDGAIGLPGDLGVTDAISDDYLQPIGSPGEHERDESLAYLPPVPTLIPLTVKGEVH